MSKSEEDILKIAEIVPVLPDWRGPDYGDPMPDDLVGATIVGIGSVGGVRLEGGGLVIEYRLRDSAERRRIVFEFTSSGGWVRFAGLVEAFPTQDYEQ